MAEIDEFVKQLGQQAAQQQSEIAQKLVSGGVADWDEYNRLTGRAKGISVMADVAYQLMKRRDMDEEGQDLPGMPQTTPGKKKPRGAAR